MNLPSRLHTRPLELADAAAVYDVLAAGELADLGVVEIELEDIQSDWARPSHDVGASSIGVFEGSRIVAYAEITGSWSYDAAVHPDFRGLGVGTWLAAWVLDLARARGASVVGMPVPEGSPGDRLLTELGYFVRWTSWVLRLPAGVTIPERPLPVGYEVRVAVPDDYSGVHEVAESAFLEWSDRERQSLEDFAATTWLRPGFEPWHLRVVVDGEGEVVGAVQAWNSGDETYVQRLAVSASQRNRGLGQALLVSAFADGRSRGATTSCLSTDSRTGALSLYEKVGMQVDSAWLHRAMNLA